MLQDLRFGLRLLFKERAFTAAALLTLALCIGANTAIFTVLQSVVLRGLPFFESARLVTLYNIYPGVGVADFGSNAVPDYIDRRKLTDVFSEVAITGSKGYDVGLSGTPQRIDASSVTPSFFTVLRARPMLGRPFTEKEGSIGNEHVAILTESLWRDMFGSDPAILGKDIRLTGQLHKIVGVMPKSFKEPGEDPKIWVPLAFKPEQTSDEARHNNNWGMIARLQPGVTIEQARRRVDALNKENTDRFPKYRALLESARFGTKVVGMQEEYTKEIRPILYLLQIAVAVVLLIGCVNLANLMLVRSNGRMKELAVRFSLGAPKWRIARQLLTESSALSLIGGLLGVAVAYGGVQLIIQLGADEIPSVNAIQIDGAVLAFTAATALVTGLLFGALPVLQVLRRDLNEVFRGNERGGTAGRSSAWVRSALVVCQFSLAFILLISAGLLTLSFSRLLGVNPGFRANNVMSARVSLNGSRYQDDASRRLAFDSLFERISSIPGVRKSGGTSYLPFSNNSNASVLMIEGRALAPGENPPVPGWNSIDTGYLPALGIPLMEGRIFNSSDGPDSAKVALIDQFIARKYWPNGGAVGARVRLGVDQKEPTATIVGIVGSVRKGNLAAQQMQGEIYFPYRQSVPTSIHVVVHSDRDDPGVINAVRSEVARIDPELPLFDVKSMSERISKSLLSRKALVVLCLIFAGLALILAAVGIYGVLAYTT
ncbi:MAG: ABC transporter permease, partial [Bryobacteraceae bacterium]|nr:ABC transporter permease [Bryobacteraceae bacterium]